MPIRLCVFQATRRPKQLVRTIQTAFGSLTIDGRLGQAHADLIECVMHYAIKHDVIGGRMGVLVDPYRIRKAMGGGEQYSAEQIKVLARDLRKAELETDAAKLNIKGHIVEKVIQAKTTVADPRGWSAGERHLELWVFSQEWTELIRRDIGRFYDPTKLCGIKHGSVAAIARHVLTHQHQHQPNGGWKLDGLMRAAGVERQASKVRTEITESLAALTEMGIEIEGNRVFLAAPARSLAAPAR